MKQGLLLKEAPEGIYIHRCWRCDSWYGDSVDYQNHLEKAHNHAYAWYYSPMEVSFEKPYVNGKFDGYYWKTINRLTNGWCKADDPKIIRRAIFSTKIRPLRRMLVTKQELKNRKTNRMCHCGKKAGNGHYLYCSDKCQSDWYQRVTDVTHFKLNFMRGKIKCDLCGKKRHDHDGTRHLSEFLEMDHIIAIVLGGHPWHEDNLQALCQTCHKEKTKSDVGILAWWKRQAKYDIGAMIPDPQLTLDNELNYNYAYG